MNNHEEDMLCLYFKFNTSNIRRLPISPVDGLPSSLSANVNDYVLECAPLLLRQTEPTVTDT